MKIERINAHRFDSGLPDWLFFSVIGIKNFVWFFGFFWMECKLAVMALQKGGPGARNVRGPLFSVLY